jgi:hypothetical protein
MNNYSLNITPPRTLNYIPEFWIKKYVKKVKFDVVFDFMIHKFNVDIVAL